MSDTKKGRRKKKAVAEPGTRFVIVSTDYLDGAMATEAREPDQWEPTVRALPIAVLDELAAAEAAWYAAQEKVSAAWAAATDVPNPDYVSDETEPSND